MQTSVSLKESLAKLQIRIRAHKEFANFDVSDWIGRFVRSKPRTAIFDLGCGDGNHLGIYLDHAGAGGRVVGLDREPSLLDEARQRYCAPNLELQAGSMDDVLPFDNESFDLCLSNFAIYNAENPRFSIGELHRILRPGGEIVLLGPTGSNARELYEFNACLTGRPADEVIRVRSDRIRSEFAPIVQDLFGNSSEEILESRLTFPSADEFLSYVRATLFNGLCAGISHAQMRSAVPHHLTVSKEMIALTAAK